MKTQAFRALCFLIVLVITTCSLVWPVCAQIDFNAYSGSPIPDNEIDGIIGPEWDDAGSVSQIAIDPWELAHVWTKHDDTYLYIGMRFYADSQNPWVAFQLGASFCMSPIADVALFGDDNYAPSGYKDVFFEDYNKIGIDSQQDGIGAISVNASNLVVVELKKPLNSRDAAGRDLNWTIGASYPLVIMWDSEGLGSGGGSTDHTIGTHTTRTILINSDTNPIPEFPNSIVILFTIGLIIPATVFAKKWATRQHRRIFHRP